jgi:hypothetical protein
MKTPEREIAIERARAHGIDIDELQAMLELTPTERLERLRARAMHSESAIRRAEAYGIDISLLKLALTWTPMQRVEKALELAAMVRTLHQAGAKKHGSRVYPQATNEL